MSTGAIILIGLGVALAILIIVRLIQNSRTGGTPYSEKRRVLLAVEAYFLSLPDIPRTINPAGVSKGSNIRIELIERYWNEILSLHQRLKREGQ